LRLLVVSQYFWPENFRINDLVSELVDRGHQVTVLTGRPNYPDGMVFPGYADAPGAFARFEGAEVLRLPLRPRGQGSVQLVRNYLSFVFWGLLLGPWKLRGRDFDAIFVFQTSPITSALPALWLRRLKRAPLLLWVLDLWPDTLAAVGVVRSPRLLALVGRVVGFIYQRCERVLIASRAFATNVERWGGRPEQIRYFPNWVEPAFAGSLEMQAVAPELAPYAACFNVLFAGNIGEAQDFPAVIEAAALLREHRPTLRWLVVGDGRALDAVRTDVARRGLQDRVLLLGRHPPKRMPAFFSGAQALLVTLKADPVFALTVPGKVQSYLAAGRPLLAMLDGEGARIIEESGAGYSVPAGDAAALARAVCRLMDEPETQRQAMGKAGQAYAMREFDRNKLMSALEDWLADVAG
jgi:glycosyltransferase involved in cell wall biosynthesis